MKLLLATPQAITNTQKKASRPDEAYQETNKIAFHKQYPMFFISLNKPHLIGTPNDQIIGAFILLIYNFRLNHIYSVP